jgi:DNA-binding NarL/FixJ family response regulator
MQISNILTKREREVLLTYAEVGQAKRVAKRLGIAQSTVESHVYNVVRKTKLNLAQCIAQIAGEIKRDTFQELPNIYATNRELEVLPYLCQGFSNIEIAKILGVTQRTVDTFLYWLMAKLGVCSRYQLIACYKCCPEKFRSSQSLRESTSKKFKIRKMLDNGYSSSQISDVLYCNRDYISRVKS